MKINPGLILGFIAFLMIVFCIFNGVVYLAANEVCEESKLMPVRYQYSGFNGRTKITTITTEGNHDAYQKVCTRRGKEDISYWAISANLEYILNDAKGEKTE